MLICPICECVIEDGPLFDVQSNAEGILKDEYLVFFCKKCSIGVTYPVPKGEQLRGLYQGMYKVSGGHAFKIIDAFLMVMVDQRLREINRFISNKGDLLDVGCGKGRFVAKAQSKGWKAKGIEPSHEQVSIARERYQVEVFEGDLHQATFPSNSFDVITAWHVLEHIVTPHALIAEIRRILRPGGLFICEVPNFLSWQARIGRGNWFHLDVPRHFVHYTPLSLERLLNQYNFRVVRQHTFSLESGPLGMMLTLLNYSGLSPNWVYRWLKRSVVGKNKSELALNLIALALVAPPAFILEVGASFHGGAGGIIRQLAIAE